MNSSSSSSSSSFSKIQRSSSKRLRVLSERKTFLAVSITNPSAIPIIYDFISFILFACPDSKIMTKISNFCFLHRKIPFFLMHNFLNNKTEVDIEKTDEVKGKSIVIKKLDLVENEEAIYKIYTLDSDNQSRELIELFPNKNFQMDESYDKIKKAYGRINIYDYMMKERIIEIDPRHEVVCAYNSLDYMSECERKFPHLIEEEEKFFEDNKTLPELDFLEELLKSDFIKKVKYNEFSVEEDYKKAIFLFDEDDYNALEEQDIMVMDLLDEIGKINVITDEHGNLSFENYRHEGDDDDEKEYDETLRLPKCL